MNGAAHADACPHRLQKGRHRIGKIDGRQPRIPDAVPHKKSVHEGIHAGQRHGQHRRHHIGQKGAIRHGFLSANRASSRPMNQLNRSEVSFMAAIRSGPTA